MAKLYSNAGSNLNLQRYNSLIIIIVLLILVILYLLFVFGSKPNMHVDVDVDVVKKQTMYPSSLIPIIESRPDVFNNPYTPPLKTDQYTEMNTRGGPVYANVYNNTDLSRPMGSHSMAPTMTGISNTTVNYPTQGL